MQSNNLYMPETYTRVVINVPPGRLGIRLIDCIDGPSISAVNDDSPLYQQIFPGDKLLTINEVDVSDKYTEGT